MSALLLVRHCQTTGQGPEDPLTELGHAQAEQLADFLEQCGPIDALYSSPYRRATQSIVPFAARRGLAVTLDDRLAERTIAPTPLPNWRELVQLAFEDPDHGVSGGETGRQVLERGWAALREVQSRGHTLAVVVGHGHHLGLLLHSLDPSFGFAGHAAMTNPDVYRLEGSTFTRLWRAR
jgi:2,3-bisphosphoglycerate-dependent phosphoglycerate mutase